MIEQNSPLDNLHIASPCHADWDKMTGDDKARFCQSCQKSVFNLSMMTRQEAERLLRQREGNLCVQYAQREDGTIITNDCPVGLEKAKFVALRPWRFFMTGITSIVATLCGFLGITPSFAQPPIDPPAHTHAVKGDIAPAKTPVKVLRGEPAPNPPTLTSEPRVITMGKPAPTKQTITIMQGGAPPPVPVPTPTHPVLMGKIVTPQHKPPVKKQVKTPQKPVAKKTPVTKSVKKR